MIYGNNSPFLAQLNPKSDKHKAKDNDLKKCNTNYVCNNNNICEG